MTRVVVHWVRHAEVASHRGDVDLTGRGAEQARSLGEWLAGELCDSETVHVRHSDTRRACQTAELAHQALLAVRSGSSEAMDAPQVHEALRNPDLYVAGSRVELVSSPDAVVAQLESATVTAEEVAALPFWQRFWAAADRVGVWVGDDDPPGEDTVAVWRRMLAFSRSLLARSSEPAQRWLCVTHSPLLRAGLVQLLPGGDTGEPEFTERLDIELDSDATHGIVRFREREGSVRLLR